MIITLANPKGGSGKTTMALVLALSMADANYNVCVVDMDPSANFKAWVEERLSRGEDIPFEFYSHNDDQENLQRVLNRLTQTDERDDYDYIILDTEGSQMSITQDAILAADLVLVPIKGDPSESRQAVKLITAIRQLEEDAKTSIDHLLAFTDVNGTIVPRDKKKIENELVANEIEMLDAELLTRQAFKTIKMEGTTLRELYNGVEVVDGKVLNPNRTMNRREKSQRDRQRRSAYTAISTANHFTNVVIDRLLQE